VRVPYLSSKSLPALLRVHAVRWVLGQVHVALACEVAHWESSPCRPLHVSSLWERVCRAAWGAPRSVRRCGRRQWEDRDSAGLRSVPARAGRRARRCRWARAWA